MRRTKARFLLLPVQIQLFAICLDHHAVNEGLKPDEYIQLFAMYLDHHAVNEGLKPDEYIQVQIRSSVFSSTIVLSVCQC